MPASNGDPIVVNTKTIRYDPTELRRIHTQLQHDYRYKRLRIDTIKVIRNLRLNHKRRGHLYTAQERLNVKPSQADHSNLILLNKGLTRKYQMLSLALVMCNPLGTKTYR